MPAAHRARVQPGLVLDTLRDAAEEHRLTFGPDPSTHSRCTLGGMIGNNSCGTHSLLAGKTVDNVNTLDLVLYDGTRMTVGPTSDADLAAIIAGGGRRGEIYAKLAALRDRYAALIRERYPQIPRRVSGYNLDQLLPENGFNVARALVGTEGTCAVVLEADVRLIDSPQHRSLVGLGFRDVFAAADAVPGHPRSAADRPRGLRRRDDRRPQAQERAEPRPHSRGPRLSARRVRRRRSGRRRFGRLGRSLDRRRPDGPASERAPVHRRSEAKTVWRIRETGPRAAGAGPNMALRWEGWDDASVAPEKLGAYLRDLRRLLDEFHYEAAYYGHFGHGCIHMQVSFDLESEPGIRTFDAFLDQAADLVVRYGGSLSGEHGDGQARASLLPKMFGPGARRGLPRVQGHLGSGRPDESAQGRRRLSCRPRTCASARTTRPPDRRRISRIPTTGGSFANAALRCTGLGACRKHDEGTMCPSYRVTLDEEHSTRGRAHMLFEMLQGEIVRDGWQNEHVKSSLDLCLSCKACKSECPTNVDVATYRAEFLSHYYASKGRPLAAHAFGFVDRWARLASTMPGLANAALRTPGLRELVRSALGIAEGRELPRFAAQDV